MPNCRIAIIDDHPVVASGVRRHLESTDSRITIVAESKSVHDFLALHRAVDVVLLDLHLGDGVSLDGIPRLNAAGCKVLIYTTEQRPVPLRKAVESGAAGVLLKGDPLPSVVEAIKTVVAGGFYVSGPLAAALVHDPAMVTDLSVQQQQILRCIDEGLDYRAVARVNGIGVNTVKEHLSRVRDKLRSRGIEPGNAHQLTRQARDEGHLL